MKKKHIFGITLILVAAFFNSLSQILWKIGTDGSAGLLWYILGFVASGLGMIIMSVAFKFGEVSILQPLMSIGFSFTTILGWIFFGEPLTLTKIIGTLTIILGAAILSTPEKKGGTVDDVQ